MKAKAETIETPVGRLRAPLHPGWPRKLAGCATELDLFALVEVGGFVDPDALNEVLARKAYGRYVAWKSARQEAGHG